ncbi:hypothetical protein [Legionella sp. W05-934-2]|uniref:hypothetical protein n=1 Tax=Legionella sp. W05-934-2 TaxID=1198649 RepID=UPI00346193AD
MAKPKATTKPTDTVEKDNKKAAQVLTELNGQLVGLLNNAEKSFHNGNPDIALIYAKETKDAYLKVMDDFAKLCKFPNEEVSGLKTTVREHYDKANELEGKYQAAIKAKTKAPEEIERITKQQEKDKQNRDARIQRQKENRERSEKNKQQKQELLSQSVKKIEDAVSKLEQDIGGKLNSLRNETAASAGFALISELKQATEQYKNDLDYSKNKAYVPLEEANAKFKKAYTEAVEKARPALESDFTIWQSIMNFIKTVSNVIVKTASLILPTATREQVLKHSLFEKSEAASWKTVKDSESAFEPKSPKG